MGKNTDEEQNIAASDGAATVRNNGRCRFSGCCCVSISSYVNLRCVLILAFSAAVFLSALFWLPPFLGLADREDLDLDPRFKDHRIVASFDVEKTVTFLENNLLQLENDITDEISFPMTKVTILALEWFGRVNRTMVTFAIDPEKENSKIPAEIESLVRAAFISLVEKQVPFTLTESMFGQPFFFEVLKFPGGITVTPHQPIFPLQNAQIVFNFTLNFSIFEIQTNFDELNSQLKKGINLAPYESLYITLFNSRGSTLAGPTIVHSSVLLTFGSSSRLKQLTQTITSSHSKNLGLNHTVFGKVKQVRLSSVLPHPPTTSSPSPAPEPESHHHHHHKHHHHHHYVPPKLAPEPSPAANGFAPASAPTEHSPSPSPSPSTPPQPPTHPPCPFEQRRRPRRGNNDLQHHNAAPTPSPTPTPTPAPSPHYPSASVPRRSQLNPPAPAPAPTPTPTHHVIPVTSPLPHVIYAHIPPPSKTSPESKPISETPSPSPTPSSASIGATFNRIHSQLLVIVAVLVIYV